MGQQKQQPKNYKKTLSSIGSAALLGAFGLLATGCSLPWSNNTANTTRTYQVRVWRVDQDIDPFRSLIKDFQKANANTVVTYDKHSIDNYEFDSLKSLAGRLGPDVWSIPNDWIGDYQDQVQTLPDNYYATQKDTSPAKPSEQIKQLYPEGIIDQITSIDGTKVYGLPTNVDTLQLYVNPSLLSAASSEYKKSLGNNYSSSTYEPVKTLLSKAPKTWDQLVEQSKYVSKRDGNTIVRGTIALGSADNVPNSIDILQLLMLQNGTKIVSDDHKNPLFHVVQSTPSGGQVRPGEKALEFITSFSDPSKQTYSWNPSMPQALDAFGQGKVAMVIGYSDFGKQMKIKYPKVSYTVAAVPQISDAQDPVNYMRFSLETVTKTADNSSRAFGFVKTYTNSSMAKVLAKEQKLTTPYLADLQKDSSIQAKQILTAQSTFKLSHTQFDAAFRQMIVDVSQNGISPQDAVKGGADKIDALLNPPGPTPQPTK